MFTGHTQQPREKAGRYARFGFDGGARQSIPSAAALTPEEAHGQVGVGLARLRALGGGFPAE